MNIYGLIGYPLSHSFSKGFFTEKFSREHIQDCIYENYAIPSIEDFPALLEAHPGIKGLNVTIPYKEQVIRYLKSLSPAAQRIGAVNCIKVLPGGVLEGYNTDVIGFGNSLLPLLKPHHKKALIFGTGGAAKAVQYVLEQQDIPYKSVSRKAAGEHITYADISPSLLATHTLLINTTPLGMYPNLDAAPEIPYQYLDSNHLLYDLVYNPAETKFLKLGAARGAQIKNGHEMLILQAEASWEIWNS
ncbi:shikimate dehydrogenase [Chitinophaga caeni]|uniref:Shikimate dehydrogenase n=1 Tax=Chitinophaga caeni TaxID=2029983 RepID=A0A291R0T8_9BACT|nr:shikimate dehydrogenase [Chitinophaga caeni]ATL49808.1 shikimate dehydrogenase [Chitinophaga caeni]